MLRNIKTCENGWSNFSENLRSIALKFLESYHQIYKFTVIYFNLVQCPRSEVRCDVDIFKLTARAQSINREAYDLTNNKFNVFFFSLKKKCDEPWNFTPKLYLIFQRLLSIFDFPSL